MRALHTEFDKNQKGYTCSSCAVVYVGKPRQIQKKYIEYVDSFGDGYIFDEDDIATITVYACPNTEETHYGDKVEFPTSIIQDLLDSGYNEVYDENDEEVDIEEKAWVCGNCGKRFLYSTDPEEDPDGDDDKVAHHRASVCCTFEAS